MKYSLCITNFNRYEMLIESFQYVLDDNRIDQVIISDDASKPEICRDLINYFAMSDKVCVCPHLENVGMLRNKQRAMSYAKNDWIILFDSDNVLNTDYLDALDKHIEEFGALNEKTVYCPDFAKPDFNFTNFSGCTFDMNNISQLIKDPIGNVAFNCCNYVINKKYFTVSDNPHVKSSDTIWINLCLLREGFYFYITPGQQYFHRVHPGSGYMEDVNYNMVMSEQIRQIILRESLQLNSK